MSYMDSFFKSNPKRLLWSSPYCSGSDVSAFSLNLMKHFEGHSTCRVFIGVNPNKEPYTSNLPMLDLSIPIEFRAYRDLFDAIVLNIGNNAENHQHIVGLLKQLPGIVIFHDYVYQHVIAKLCFDYINSPELYAFLMTEYYGMPALEVIERSGICSKNAHRRLYAPWDSFESADFPLSELFVNLGSAVVVHSEYSENYVKTFFNGPILRLQLPFDQKRTLSDADIDSWRDHVLTAKKITVVSFGHISRQKCLHVFLNALACNKKLSGLVTYYIVGHIGDQKYVNELKAIVKNQHLEDCVRFEFSVSNERLLELKMLADVFFNVRSPNTEGASGSLVEQLNTGKAVIVTDSGCCAEIPSDAVIKIHDPQNATTVAKVIFDSLSDRQKLIHIGEQGMAYVRRLDGRQYVENLVSFLADNWRQLSGAHKNIRNDYVTTANLLARMCLGAENAQNESAWGQEFNRTRMVWQIIDSDAHLYGPYVFLNWESDQLVRYICIALLDEPYNEQLHSYLTIEINADRYRFYTNFSKFRFIFDFLFDPPEKKLCFIDPIPLNSDIEKFHWEMSSRLNDDRFISFAYFLLYHEPVTPVRMAILQQQVAESKSRTLVVAALINEAQLEGRISKKKGAQLLKIIAAPPDFVMGGIELPVSKNISFSSETLQATRYLRGEWYHLESNGVWSRFNQGRLLFVIPKTISEIDMSRLVLSVHGRTPEHGNIAPPLTLTLFVNGQQVEQVDQPMPTFTTFSLNLSRCKPGELVLVRFQISKRVCLKELGLSDDDRELGFFLNSVKLCLAEKDCDLTPQQVNLNKKKPSNITRFFSGIFQQ